MVVYYVTQSEADEGSTPDDAAMRARVPFYFAISCLMVLLQCCSTAGLANGVMKSSCVESDQCQERGTFCHPKINRCEYCGSDEAVIPPWTKNGDMMFLWEPTKPGYNFTWVVVRALQYLT
jgi:hypothetical protein